MSIPGCFALFFNLLLVLLLDTIETESMIAGRKGAGLFKNTLADLASEVNQVRFW